jgi:hypothetical protein
VGRPKPVPEEAKRPAEGGAGAEEREAAPVAPKRPRFLGLGKKEDRYGAKVKGAGEARGKPAAEHRKTERGTKRGRKKK